MELQSFIIRLVEKNNGEILGRVRLQKLVYFCKALGADIDANYKLYIYGPFCQQVADILQDCVMEDILQEKDGIIQKGSEFRSCLASAVLENTSLSRQSMEIMEDVLNICGRLNTKELEITATTFFINRQQKVLFGCDDRDVVIDKVTRAKGNRFSRKEIEMSYQRVLEEYFPLVDKYAAIK